MKTQNKLSKPFKAIKTSIEIKLATLWISFMFLYIKVDYFALYMPNIINDIQKGKVFVFDITQGFILAALIAFMVPVLMIFLSVALKAEVNRWTNIVVATIHIPYMLFNLAGTVWMHMIFAAVIEVVILCLIIRYAWTWPRNEPSEKNVL